MRYARVRLDIVSCIYGYCWWRSGKPDVLNRACCGLWLCYCLVVFRKHDVYLRKVVFGSGTILSLVQIFIYLMDWK
uniref:Uncharacterized protein n=1 Tax=Zea mays TaxID=4577 RepID=B4FFK1_MAIZE|nr:unknown [Zea mays]ACR37502.1 unknown [Zea mays]